MKKKTEKERKTTIKIVFLLPSNVHNRIRRLHSLPESPPGL